MNILTKLALGQQHIHSRLFKVKNEMICKTRNIITISARFVFAILFFASDTNMLRRWSMNKVVVWKYVQL